MLDKIQVLDGLGVARKYNEKCAKLYGRLLSMAAGRPSRLCTGLEQLGAQCDRPEDLPAAAAKYKLSDLSKVPPIGFKAGDVAWAFNRAEDRPQKFEIRRTNGVSALCCDPDTHVGGTCLPVSALYATAEMAEVCAYARCHEQIRQAMEGIRDLRDLAAFPLRHNLDDEWFLRVAYAKRAEQLIGYDPRDDAGNARRTQKD